MAHNVTLDYDLNENIVTVNDSGKKSAFYLRDNKGKLFYYILQILDDLDNGSGSINSDWEEEDSSSKAYVKNRTHYINRTYSDSARFTLESGATDPAVFSSNRIQTEYLFNVTINKQVYKNVQFKPAVDLSGNSFYYFGNPKLDKSLNDLDEDYNYFFLIKDSEVVDLETGDTMSEVSFFSDEAGEYSIEIVNTGNTIVPVPSQREYTFEDVSSKVFFTFPTSSLPESLDINLNYNERVLPLVTIGDSNLFFYGNSEIVKNYLSLKGVDSSIVDVESCTDIGIAFIGILSGENFVFHCFSEPGIELMLQIPNVESDQPFYNYTPLEIATTGLDIDIPEADLEPLNFDATCELTGDYETAASSLIGIDSIFVEGRVLCANLNGEKYKSEIINDSGVLSASFDLGDSRTLTTSLNSESFVLVTNFISDSLIDISLKSITSEEYVPMDPKFVPSTMSVSASSTDAEFPTAKSVWNAIKGGIIYKGTVSSESDLPADPGNGWMYVADTAFTMTSGEKVEVGDELFWAEDTSTWDIIQGNTDGVVLGPESAVDGHVALFDGTSGKLIKDGGLIPEVWEIGKASYKPNDSTPKVSFVDVKCDGVLYNGKLSTYITVIKNGIVVNMTALSAGSATTFVNGAFDAPLSQSQIDFVKDNADTILFRIGTADGSKLLNATFLLPLRAESIAANENGFTSGDQVNTVVSNLQNGTIVVGKATADGSGNNIANTYAIKADTVRVQTVTGNTPSITAENNYCYRCGTVSTLTITATSLSTIFFDVTFTSGSTPTVLTVPAGITWANGFDPTSLEANKHYELNVMDGVGIALATEVGA